MSTHRVVPSQVSTVHADWRAIDRPLDRGDWLDLGDRGAAVAALQRELRAADFFHGNVDGRFDRRTEDAVKAFQRARKLTVDGKVGPETFRALRKNDVMVADDFAQSAKRGQSGADILDIEQKLARLGISPGKVDGVFDASTERAVSQFRRRDPQLADGPKVIDRQLQQELDKEMQRLPRAKAGAPPPGGAAPREDYRRVRIDGHVTNRRTQQMLDRAQHLMRTKYGHPGFDFTITQGSYTNGRVKESGETHDGGGALDIRTRGRSRDTVDDMVRALREAGFAAWSRGRGHDTMKPHIHAIAIGDRDLSGDARAQTREYARGGNGLRGNAPDPDRGLGRPIPSWARRHVD